MTAARRFADRVRVGVSTAAAAALLAGGCVARLPPSRMAPGPPTLSSSPGAGTRGSPPVEASSAADRPTVQVGRRLPVIASAIAAEGGDAWYLREDPPFGYVGHVPSDGSRPVELLAGPTPVDLDVGPDALYVLEGVPTDDPRKGLPRVGVLEKLDRESLRVIASRPIPGLPVDVLLDGDRVWVGGVRGIASSFDATTLAPIATADVSGDGPTTLAAGDGAIWLLDGSVEAHEVIVHRLDPISAREQSAWGVPGDGVSAQIAVGTSVWVAAAVEAATHLFPVSPTGVAGPPLRLPRLAGLVASRGRLWWLSTTAEVTMLDEATLIRSAPADVGDVGQAFAVSGRRVWVASEEIVELAASR